MQDGRPVEFGDWFGFAKSIRIDVSLAKNTNKSAGEGDEVGPGKSDEKDNGEEETEEEENGSNMRPKIQ